MTQRKKLHQQIAENLQAQRDGETAPNTPEAEKNDLDKREVQARIMDPNGTAIKLSYGSIVVYPLSMRNRRRASGFLARITADAVGAGARSEGEALLRVASLLTQREDLEVELFRLSALACFKPGSFKDDNDEKVKTLPIIAEFQEKCNYEDSFALFGAISDLSEFTVPKT